MPKRYATVKREKPDRLAIDTHYVLEPGESNAFRGFGTRWINRPESYLGVAFEDWDRYVDQTVPFSELRGEGEGMIGGPTKTTVGENGSIWLYHGVLDDFELMMARRHGDAKEIAELEEEVNQEIVSWSQLLEDDSYDLSEDSRQRIKRMIAVGQTFLLECEWKRHAV